MAVGLVPPPPPLRTPGLPANVHHSRRLGDLGQPADGLRPSGLPSSPRYNELGSDGRLADLES